MGKSGYTGDDTDYDGEVVTLGTDTTPTAGNYQANNTNTDFGSAYAFVHCPW